MKRKIYFGLISLFFVAILSFSITKVVKANVDPYRDLCNYWCSMGGISCKLHVEFSDGTTGYVTCGNMMWPD